MRLRFLRLPLSLVFWFASTGLVSPTSSTISSRELSFRDRVRAQEALERVRFSHQIGDTRPFQEAVPPSLLDNKVRTYLKQSVALERFWKTSVTSEMLHKELERMARQSQMPERLRELFSALGNDPVLIQECLVRPVLVERLIHNFFDFDQRLHAASRREADSLRRRLALGTLDPASDYPGRVVRDDSDETGPRSGSPLSDADPLPGELLSRSDRFKSVPSGATRLKGVPKNPGEVGPVLEERDGFVFRVLLNQDTKGMRVASYSIAKERFEEWWNEVEPGLNEALIQPAASDLDPLPATEASALTTSGGCLFNDSWSNQSLGDPPSARYQHGALWTGSLMLIWGGYSYETGWVNTGGRYDPATYSWSRISTVGAPYSGHLAVWTGSRMIVWGGSFGRIYDPLSDTWSVTSTWTGTSPTVAVWAGGRMVLWNPNADSGGRYNPATDSWEGVSPSVTGGVAVISTGDSMITWGGRGPGQNTGARYDPTTDTWTPLATLNAPAGRSSHTAVWTGTEMIIWGGTDGTNQLVTGGRYNPTNDTWLPISTFNAPSVAGYRAEWAGGHMVIWKETVPNQPPGIGARYNPATDSWAPMSMVNAPSGFHDFTTVSTGDQMILWGGRLIFGPFDTHIYSDSGGRYDPVTDTWTPTTAPLTPTGRIAHSAVWTGNVMVVWGGDDLETYFDTGGRYDPALDVWTPTSLSGAPIGRSSFTTLWTGSKMIVWGGAYYDDATQTTVRLDSGGRYDPIADSWSPTALAGAPTPRRSHKAVWTGSRMIVWGGHDGSARVNTGGLYDPVNDSWTDTPTTGAPSARSSHSAVWTGSRMIIWGGYDGSFQLTGALYDPVNDSWTDAPTTGAPSARYAHSAVWTGNEMIVWGGYGGTNLNTGGRFNPTNGMWNATATAGAPSPRSGYKAVWTGSEMVIWGGSEVEFYGIDTGGRYSPSGDSWQPTSMTNVPRKRLGYDAIFTSSALLLWGGLDTQEGVETGPYYVYPKTGGQYCLCAMSPHYRDADADGFGDAASPLAACAAPPGYVNTAGDCNDSNAGLWGTPSEALDLSFIDGVTLAWSPPASPGANSVSYDLIRSGNPADFVSAASCTASDSPIASATDAATPALAGSFHYLVRVQNGCPGGVGPLGNASDGTPRAALDCP